MCLSVKMFFSLTSYSNSELSVQNDLCVDTLNCMQMISLFLWFILTHIVT